MNPPKSEKPGGIRLIAKELLTSASITQYADFNLSQESLFERVHEAAKHLVA
jgi:hypothetical protein